MNYHSSWLQIALENFKNSNDITIDGSLTIDEFIEKYAKEELDKVVEVK